jgi:hypothetical protein
MGEVRYPLDKFRRRAIVKCVSEEKKNAVVDEGLGY